MPTWAKEAKEVENKVQKMLVEKREVERKETKAPKAMAKLVRKEAKERLAKMLSMTVVKANGLQKESQPRKN